MAQVKFPFVFLTFTVKSFVRVFIGVLLTKAVKTTAPGGCFGKIYPKARVDTSDLPVCTQDLAKNTNPGVHSHAPWVPGVDTQDPLWPQGQTEGRVVLPADSRASLGGAHCLSFPFCSWERALLSLQVHCRPPPTPVPHKCLRKDALMGGDGRAMSRGCLL